MKNLLLFYSLLISLSFGLVSCNDDDSDDMPEPSQNIVQIAQDNGYTSLATALTITGLVDDIQEGEDLTVFAPTNEAFDQLLDAIGQTSIEDVPVNVLEQILLYHVIPARVLSSEITDGNAGTLLGQDVTLSTQDGIKVNGINVINPFDVEASNGVIHTIGSVLVPENIAQFVNTVLEPAYFNKNFSDLVSAVVKAELVDALLTTPNLTIFAPTNDAFAAAGIDVDATGKDILTAVLTYHVVGAKVLSSGIPRNAATLNGAEIFFSSATAGSFINGNAQIVAVDIESGTGVVHVIDNVLIPPMGNIVETAIEISNTGEFTSLIAALQRTADEGTPSQNLLTVLSGDGPFTVFAPTNAAFQAVLDSNPAWNGLEDIPLDVLISVLTYHVVPARAYDKDLEGAIDVNNELPTAFGQNIKIDLDNMTVNGSSNIIGVNYHATNGVIHVIDNVLLPN